METNLLEDLDNNSFISDLDTFLDTNSQNNINTLDSKEMTDGEPVSTPNEDLDKINIGDLPLDFDLPETAVAKSDIIEQRDELKLGLSAEDLKDLYNYISGKGDKPLFIDKFTSDSEGRLKDELYIMNLLLLSKLPMLVSFQAQIQDLMYRPENLGKMDIKELSSASKNVSAEIQNIIKSTTESMQVLNNLGSLNNEYRQLLNLMTQLPEEKLARVKEIMLME